MNVSRRTFAAAAATVRLTARAAAQSPQDVRAGEHDPRVSDPGPEDSALRPRARDTRTMLGVLVPEETRNC